MISVNKLWANKPTDTAECSRKLINRRVNVSVLVILFGRSQHIRGYCPIIEYNCLIIYIFLYLNLFYLWCSSYNLIWNDRNQIDSDLQSGQTFSIWNHPFKQSVSYTCPHLSRIHYDPITRLSWQIKHLSAYEHITLSNFWNCASESPFDTLPIFYPNSNNCS